MNEMLFLFLVAPKGYEQLTSVVVAPSKEIASSKAMTNPAIKELTDMDVELTVVNVSSGMAVQGYNVNITKSGMFH
jgi:hypothetical protein